MDFLDGIIGKILAGAVEYLRIKIMRSGIDRVTLEKWTMEHKSSDPEMFSYGVVVNSMEIVGLADFKVQNFNLIAKDPRVDFDVYIPEIVFSFGDIEGFLKYLLQSVETTISGRIIITEPRVTGKANFSKEFGGGDYEPFSSVDTTFRVKSIKADLRVIFNNKDYSETVNHFLNEKLPQLIKDNRPTASWIITRLIQTIVKYVLRADATSKKSAKSNVSDFFMAMLKSSSGLPPDVLKLLVALSKLKVDS